MIRIFSHEIEVNFSVVENMRLTNGVLFSMPITLDVSEEEIEKLRIAPKSRITLRDFRDEQPLAILTGMRLLDGGF